MIIHTIQSNIKSAHDALGGAGGKEGRLAFFTLNLVPASYRKLMHNTMHCPKGCLHYHCRDKLTSETV